MERIVDAIFKTEAAALGYSTDKIKNLRERYNDYVFSITATVHDHVPIIRNEREVFEHLAGVFYSNFDYAKRKMVLTGLESKPHPAFNCYGSSVMFADIMTDLGVDFKVAIAPNHVFLVGKKYRFETTENKGKFLLNASDIGKEYPHHSIGGVDFLLAASYAMSGLHFMDEKRNKEAIGQFKKSLEINPKNSDVQYNLGLSYWKEGQYDSAIASFKAALTLNGDDGNIHYGLGISYYQKGDYNTAIKYYKLSLKEKKTTPNEVVYDGMAKAYEMVDKPAAAAKYYRMSKQKKH